MNLHEILAVDRQKKRDASRVAEAAEHTSFLSVVKALDEPKPLEPAKKKRKRSTDDAIIKRVDKYAAFIYGKHASKSKVEYVAWLTNTLRSKSTPYK